MTNFGRMSVAIFSFNRGDYLEKCIQSVVDNMPDIPIIIFDDNSDDPKTIDYLNSLDWRVYRPQDSGSAQHGGLYANMQRALELTRTEFVFFLQDDMQVVRPVSSNDYSQIDAIFRDDPHRAFVHPLFMKEIYIERFKFQFVPNTHLRIYEINPNIQRDKMRYAYSDVCIAHVARLREANWKFAQGEGYNEAQAKRLFSNMPFMGDPIAFYCPEVPSYRNRKKTLSGRITEWLATGEVKEFHPMNTDEIDALLDRPLSQYPVAEDYLHPLDMRVKRPYVYQDFLAHRWLYPLVKMEYLFASLKRRIKRLKTAIVNSLHKTIPN